MALMVAFDEMKCFATCSDFPSQKCSIFESLHWSLQCDLRFVGILWDVFGQEKSPRALILNGFLIFPGLLGTLLDYPDGGEEEDRTPDLRIANATLSQLSYAPISPRL